MAVRLDVAATSTAEKAKKMAIVINKLQLRHAIELAATRAAQIELAKQVTDQLPGRSVTVTGADIHVSHMEWPEFGVVGESVMWE